MTWDEQMAYICGWLVAHGQVMHVDSTPHFTVKVPWTGGEERLAMKRNQLPWLREPAPER